MPLRSPRMSPRTLLVMVCAGVIGAVLAVVPEHAEAYRLGGKAWPKRVITYRVTVPAFRAPVRDATAQWNQSGVRVQFREVRAGRADVLVKTLRVPRLPPGVIALDPCGLGGAAGRAQLGYSRHFQAHVWLDRRCSQTALIGIAAHEFGHILGLAHTSARCAAMSPSGTSNCADERRQLPWEYTCKVLRPDDVAGAIRRYGGRLRPMPANRTCLRAPTPQPVSGVTVEPNPPGSIATSRVTWQNPASDALRRVIVMRKQGECPNVPSAPGRVIYTRSGLTPVDAQLVADVPAQRGAAAGIADLEPMPAGRTCYTVWAMGPDDRYLDGVTATVDHPGTDSTPARIGLTARVESTPDVVVRLSWTNPSDPGLGDVRILRSTGGPCPVTAAEFSGFSVAAVPAAPGLASFDDATFGQEGPRCYGVEFHRADGYLGTVNTLLVHVDVPVTA